jgi:hypothetical protein
MLVVEVIDEPPHRIIFPPQRAEVTGPSFGRYGNGEATLSFFRTDPNGPYFFVVIGGFSDVFV